MTEAATTPADTPADTPDIAEEFDITAASAKALWSWTTKWKTFGGACLVAAVTLGGSQAYESCVVLTVSVEDAAEEGSAEPAAEPAAEEEGSAEPAREEEG